MVDIEPKFADVIAQAEILCARQQAALQALQAQRLVQQQRWNDAQAARLKFLRKYDATPMDVNAYDHWLGDFVAAGGELTHFVEGNFPRIRLIDGDLTALFAETDINVPNGNMSLAEDYFSEPVIWTIDARLDINDLPALVGDQALTLHLTQNAVGHLTRDTLTALSAAGVVGENEFYVDGERSTSDDAWRANAYVVQAIPYVWNENIRNMMGKKVLL